MMLSMLRMLTMEISDRIKQRMAELGIKGVDITRVTGVSSGGVSQWVNGVTKPNGEKLLALSRVLRCNPEWLLTGRTDLAATEAPAQTIPILNEQQAVQFIDSQRVPDKVNSMPSLVDGTSGFAFGLMEESEQFAPAIPREAIYHIIPMRVVDPRLLSIKTVLVRIDNHLLTGRIKALSMGRYVITLADGTNEPLPNGLKHIIGLVTHIQLP